MRDSVYRFTLDIHDIESQVQIVAKKNDVARKIYATLMEEGKPYAIESGCLAVLMMKKPDGTILFNDCYIVNSGSVIAYDFTEQTTSAEGLCECEIRIYDTDGNLITSPRFTMIVSENVYEDGQIESTNEFISLKEAYVGANNMDIDAEDGTITITRKDGSKKTVFESTDGYIDVPTEEEIEEVRNSIRDIVDVQQSVDADLTSIHSQITEINNDIDTVNGQIGGISEELIAVNGSIENINNAIEGIDGNILSINNSLEDKQDKLIAGTNIVISEDGRTISSIGGGGGGSTVSMEDVADGGVKLIVDGEYRVIAKESELPTSEDRSRWDGKMDQVTLASVATSGSYNDLSEKPSIDSELSGTSTNAIQNNVVYDAINALNENAASLDASIKKNESDISTINGNISTINGSIETINGDISTINGDISTLNSKLSSTEIATPIVEFSTTIKEVTNPQSGFAWQATEDCFVVLYSSDTGVINISILVDNVTVHSRVVSSTVNRGVFSIYVGKGQTVSLNMGNNFIGKLTAYPLKKIRLI